MLALLTNVIQFYPGYKLSIETDKERKEGKRQKHLPVAAVQSVAGKICRRDREHFTKRQH